jgi:predicted dehydrogenase
MQRTRPRVAIVGAGLMGRWHAHAAARAGAQVVAVVDADGARAHALAARHRARPLGDLTELQQLTPVAGVAHLCTPAATHGALTRQLLDAGLHVVCEKPLAARGDDVAALLAHAQRVGRRLVPVHQFAHQDGVTFARSRLSDLGSLRRIAFTFSSAGGDGREGAALDTIVEEILPHPLSVLAVLQPGVPLDTIGWSTRSTAPGEWLAIGRHGAALVSIAISLGARPTEASATVAGSAATVRLDFFHGFAVIQRGAATRRDKMLRPFANALALLGAASAQALRRTLRWEPAYPGLRTLLQTFYQQLDAPAATIEQDDAAVVALYRARDLLVAAQSGPEAA